MILQIGNINHFGQRLDQTVAKYIREQEGHDIAMDKLSVKEYQNPFEDKEMKKENKKERRR